MGKQNVKLVKLARESFFYDASNIAIYNRVINPSVNIEDFLNLYFHGLHSKIFLIKCKLISSRCIGNFQ
jgi:hypothetical protein